MAEYYMRADGTAANKAAATGPASDASKCMSIATHNGETFSGGDIINISSQGGTYTTILAIPSSGSSGNPIIYQAISGETPIFDMGGLETDCITVQNKSYLTFDGLTLKDPTARSIYISVLNSTISNFIIQNCTFTGSNDGRGIFIGTSSNYNISDITIQDCSFSTMDDSAISLYLGGIGNTGNIYDVTLNDCTFSNLLSDIKSVRGFDVTFEDLADALTSNRLPYGLTIQNCTFDTINASPIRIYCKDTSSNLIANNILIRSGYGGNYGGNAIQTHGCKGLIIEYNDISYGESSPLPGDGNAIIIDYANSDPNYICDGVIVRYNRCHHNTPQGESRGAGISFYRAKNCTAYYNICADNLVGILMDSGAGGECTGNVFYNNTLINNSGDGIAIESNSPTQTWTNNIIANNGGEGVDDNSGNDPTFTYNCLHNNTGGNYSGFTLGTDCIELDPKFNNIVTGDYLLQSNSPCKDSGDKSIWSGTASINDHDGHRITNAAGQIVTPGFDVSMGAQQHQYDKNVRKPILNPILKKSKFTR